jgi:hypothetical protein
MRRHRPTSKGVPTGGVTRRRLRQIDPGHLTASIDESQMSRTGRSCANCTHHDTFTAMMGCVIWQRVVATLHRAG